MTATRGEPTGRRRFAPLLILLLLILLGFALRVHNLDAFSFWTDEGLTPERSGYPIAQILRNDILIQGVVTKDTHPPLYYLIIHLTRQLFGVSDFAFRYPSVLFGVLLIPLLYQLGRRVGDSTVGLLAALLLVTNPLHVYYSQEARMYTLLVFLVTGMSYVLWQAIRSIDHRPQATDHSGGTTARDRRSVARGLPLYTLLAALALYTHYTVAFLIAAQALFWAWVLWRVGLRWVILGAAAVAALVAVPLIPYTIPRLLAGAEANYYAVPPLTMLLDVVRFFHLGLTVDHNHALIVALNVLAFGLLLLGVWASASYEIREAKYDERVPDSYLISRLSYLSRPLFLLSWLLAVVFGLMAGSLLFKPMYQGVRHIMAGSPAFLLLLAFGVWALLNRRRPDAGPSRHEQPPEHASFRGRWPAAGGLFVLALLLTGSTFALYNLYNNPAYVKDDFRAIVRFIETRAGDRDVIVYNNAVLLPLHDHYRRRPDIAVTALPAYPQYATGQEPELAALARDYDRVWFITDPPADKRDEEKRIQGWLDTNLTEVLNRLFPARTTEARVIGYQTTADRRSPMAIESKWAGLPELVGVAFDSPLAAPTLWVDLLWEGERPEVNASLLFTLTGPDGAEYYRQARSLLPDEDTRWVDGAPNRISYDLPLPPGMPPGVYTLAVTPESRDTLPLGEVEIASTDAWAVPPEVLFGDTELTAIVGRPSALEWPNGLALAAVAPWDDMVLPGNNLPLTLYWRVGPEGIDLSDIRYRLEVIDRNGEVLRTQEDTPGAPWLGLVAPGALLREDTGLYFRPETPPGDYRLRWTLLDGDAPLGNTVTSGHVRVEPWPLETDVPPAPYLVEADFGSAVRLHSYHMGIPTGGLLNLALYWQTITPPDRNYLVFIHLVDEAGNIVSQIDTVPAGGTRPTTGWRAGEVITDIHNLPIPDDLPPGIYRVNVGLYDPDDGTRPPVTVDGTRQPDNQLRLAPTLDLPGGES